jgi:predicted cupin superfamily sugar epimerase
MDETIFRIVERFDLQPHPEGGYFREVYQSDVWLEHPNVPEGCDARRRSSTLIYYLLGREDFSAFHRVRWTDEIWHLYSGGPLELHTIDDEGNHELHVLASDVTAAEPTAVVPAGRWQAARVATGANWALGGCTVAPGFDFQDFEMPSRLELLECYPQHAEIIESLTKR